MRAALAGNLTDVAASLAYYAFLAIPAALLVAVGVFGLAAGPGTVEDLLDRLEGVVPDDALSLIDDIADARDRELGQRRRRSRWSASCWRCGPRAARCRR